MREFLLALATCTISMSVVAAVALLLAPALAKRYSARGIYCVLAIIVVGFLIPFRPQANAPAVTLTLPPERLSSARIEAVKAEKRSASVLPSDVGDGRAIRKSEIAMPEKGIEPETVVFLVWLSGAVCVLCVQIARHRRGMRVIKRWSEQASMTACLTLESEKADLGIKRNVALLVCKAVSSPMLAGIFRPVVVLPEELSPKELALVLRHELWHLRGRDLWVRALLLAAASVHFFNPVIYLLGRALSYYCEAACDAGVTRGAALDARLSYGETILTAARGRNGLRTALSTNFNGGKRVMKRRINAILDTGKKRLGALLICMTLLASLGTGMGLALTREQLPDGLDALIGKDVYVAREHGSPMVYVPTPNDLEFPWFEYFQGAKARVVGWMENETAISAYHNDGRALDMTCNLWLHVLVGGDGEKDGVLGLFPLDYIALEAPDAALPTATVLAGGATVYTEYAEDSEKAFELAAGDAVTLLCWRTDWVQVQAGDRFGFVRADRLSLPEDVLDAMQASEVRVQFSDSTMREVKLIYRWEKLITPLQEQYGENVEEWPPEQRAFYSQTEIETIGFAEPCYLLPTAEDMTEEAAVAKAKEAFMQACELPASTVEEYTVTAYLFCESSRDDTRPLWYVSFRLWEDDTAINSFDVTLSSPSGEVVRTADVVEFEHREARLADAKEADAALATWEQEKGPMITWSAEDALAFTRQYGVDGDAASGEEQDPSVMVAPEKAREIGMAAISAKYGVTKETLMAYDLDMSLEIDMNVLYDEPYYYFFFSDPADETNHQSYAAFVFAYSGEIMAVSGPDDGNG